MNRSQREQVRSNALYLQNVRPIDPEEICEYVDGQPHPAAVRQVLREMATDLGLVEREDQTFVPVETGPVSVEFDGVTAFPGRYGRALDDLLVERYGTDWHDGESGASIRERIRTFKAAYLGGDAVEYDAETALAYAIYHLPGYYASAQYVLAALADDSFVPQHLRVLDVGAGVGGPALGLCDLLPDDALVDYHAVEPSNASAVLDALLDETGCNVHATIHDTTAEAFDPFQVGPSAPERVDPDDPDEAMEASERGETHEAANEVAASETGVDGSARGTREDRVADETMVGSNPAETEVAEPATETGAGISTDETGGDTTAVETEEAPDAKEGREQSVDGQPDGFDLILFSNVLSELDDPEAVLRRYANALRPDGTLVALAPADRNTAIGLREIERDVADHGPYDVYAPTVRLWPGHTPSDECWSFDVRPDLDVPDFQRRLDRAATGKDVRDGEFVNVDVQFAYSLLRLDGRRRYDISLDPARVARFADSEAHVTNRVDCFAAKLSRDLSDGGNPLFLLGDGSQQTSHFAVLTKETSLNRALVEAEYGEVLGFENVLVLWNDDEEAYNLVVDDETIVDSVPR